MGGGDPLFADRHLAEILFHDRLDLGNLDIADDDHGHAVGRVPVFVELHETLARRAGDHFLDADGHALRDPLIRESKADLVDEGAPIDRIAIAFLAEDDAAFVLNLIGAEEHSIGIVAEELHALVDHGRIGLRQLKLIDRFVEGGVRVGVIAEAHPEALEILDHLAGGEILRAVEGHVLEEVREPLLVVVFHQRTRIDEEAHADTIGWFGIREDGVAQPVFEEAPLHRRIDGDIAVFVWQRDRVGGVDEGDAGEKGQGGEQTQGHGQGLGG